MFRNLRKSHLTMNNEEALEVLEQGEYGVVSVIGPDGYPYGVPMSYVVMDGHIYFHGDQIGHKMECLEHSNKVCFTVIGKTQLLPEILDTDYESVVVFGTATEVDGQEKEQALMGLVSKYSPGFEAKGLKSMENEFDITAVIKIEIKHITGKLRWGDQR